MAENPAAEAALQAEAEKWATFHAQLDPSCWTQAPGAADEGGAVLWTLADGWRGALFGEAYAAVSARADPALRVFEAVCFLRRDGVHEVRVASRVQPGQVYDLRWAFRAPEPGDDDGVEPCGGPERRLVEIHRRGPEGRVLGPANAVWRIAQAAAAGATPGDADIRIFCADIDETVDVNLGRLSLQRRESAQQQHARFQAQQIQAAAELQPWAAVLYWMAALKRIDPTAYRRVPPPIRGFLESRADAWQAVGYNEIRMFQAQGVLPRELPRLEPDKDMAEAKAAVATQKSVITQPTFLMMFQNVSPIPPLMLAIDPEQIGPLDVQAFMTIGALREMHGKLQARLEELGRSDPKLRMLIEGPQGQRQLLQDPRLAALRADREIMRELEDQQDLVARRGGNIGPTQRDAMRMMNRLNASAGPQLAATLAGPMVGMAAMFGQNAMHASSPPDPGQPPWKLYEPYIC